MRRQRLRFEFRVELAAEEPWVISQLNDFDEILIGRNSGNNQAMVRERLFKLTVEFVPVTMQL